MAGLHFDITGDNKNLLRNLEGSKQGIRSLTREAEKESSNMDDIMKRIGQSAAAIGVGFSATQLIRDVARVRGEFQQLEVALTTMLGSEEKANALFEQLVNTAAKTPFDLKGVAGGAKQLLAYGVAAEEVNDTIIRLGDIAAGLSIPLGDLVYLYGTTMTQGRLFTQDLRQFMGRGIPLADELAKQFGVAKDEVGELVTAGKVGFPEVQKAIMAMTSEGGKFGGLMEKQSKTITGQISNLQDAVDSMFNEIGKSTQGIISGVLSTTTQMVENYEKVGEAIGVIVTAYGSYKAALMIGVAYKKAEMAVLRQAVVEKALSAGATTALSNAELIAAGRTKLLTAMTKQLTAALKAKTIALMNNPYVLAAVAVTAVVAGIYKLVTAKSAEEKAIDRVNKKREEENKKTEEQKQNIDKLLGVINDDTETRYNQKKAYEDLAKEVPELTNELSLEAFQAMSAAEQTKKLNEVLESIKISKAESQISEYNRLLSELMASGGSWYNLSLETRDALRNMFGNDWKPNVKEATAFLQKEINNTKAMVDDYNESTKPLEVKIEDAQKASDNAKVAFEAAKKALEDEQKRYEQEKEKYGWAIPVRFDIQQAYENAKSEMQQTDANLQKLQGQQGKGDTSGGNYAEAFNTAKKVWEDADKALQDAIKNRANYTVKQYDELVKSANDAAENFKKLGGDTSKKKDDTAQNEERAGDIFLDIMKKNNRERVALQHEGDELLKEQIKLDYEERLEEIAKQEEEIKKLQGGTLTIEQQAAFQESRDIATEQKNRAISKVGENTAKEIAENRETYEQLIKDYGTYEEKKLAITNEYNELIAQARKEQAEDPENAEVYNRAIQIYETQMNEALSSLYIESEGVTTAIANLFSDFTDKSISDIKEIANTGEDVMTLLANESYDSALGSALSIDEATWAQLRQSPEALDAIREALEKLKEKTEELKSPFENIKDGLDKIFSAKGDKGQTIEGLRVLKEGLGDVSNAASFVQSSLATLGDALGSDVLSGIADGIGSAMNVMDQTMSGAQAGAAFGPVGAAIGAVMGLATSLVSEISKAHDEKKQKEIEQTQNKVDNLRESYNTLEEAVDAAYGKTAVQGLKEMNANLEQQNKLIEEQKRAEEEKKKTDESAMQGYDDAMEANRKQMEENTKAMEEAIFGDDIKSAIDSFAEAYGDAIAEGKDLNQSMKDHAVQMMKQMVQEEIKAYIAGQGKLEALREKMALYFEDGVFSDSEIAAIKAEAEAIGKDLDRKFAWAEDLLAEEDSSSSGSSSKRGIATASQESVDENNGRLMSIQLSMGEIKEQMIYTVTYLASMTSSISSSNHILSDIREQAVRTNGHLEDIVKYTKPLNDKISEVVSAVNRINSK